jgi:hypothetical protein
MKNLFKRRPSVALVLALLALVVAMGNGAYAAVTAQKNSVVSKSIKNGQVKTPDLAPGAVTTKKLKGNAVGSAKLKDGAVTSADIAENGVEWQHIAPWNVGAQHLAGTLTVTSTSPPTGDSGGVLNGGGHGIAEATAACPSGSVLLGGGATWVQPSSPGTDLANVYIQASRPQTNSWVARGVVDFGAQGTIRLQTVALCLLPASTN